MPIFAIPLYKNGNVETRILRNVIFETPIQNRYFRNRPPLYNKMEFKRPFYKNDIFETPYTKMEFLRPFSKWHFRDLHMQKMEFSRPLYSENGIFGPLRNIFLVLTPHTKMVKILTTLYKNGQKFDRLKKWLTFCQKWTKC